MYSESTMSTLPTIPHLINGQRVAGGSRAQDVFNPATGRAEKRVLLADKATVEQAIASAQAAYPAWRATPPLKRARVMSNLKVLLEQHADELTHAHLVERVPHLHWEQVEDRARADALQPLQADVRHGECGGREYGAGPCEQHGQQPT